MSKYLEKLHELVLMNPKDKTVYYSKMSDYKKASLDTQKAFDENAHTLFDFELNKISDYSSIGTKYLKNIYLMTSIIFVLLMLSLITGIIFLLLPSGL